MKNKILSLALATAMTVTMLFGAVTAQSQQEISDKVVRLHVLANSDSDADQALKLKVRDAVLDEVDLLLNGVENKQAAKMIIEENLDQIAAAAGEELSANGAEYPVYAELVKEEFSTRNYDTFSLPAGVYTSLRVSIGEAVGRNWWCVVYPPMCKAAAIEDVSEELGLTKGEVLLICGEKENLEIKFKTLEIIKYLRELLR